MVKLKNFISLSLVKALCAGFLGTIAGMGLVIVIRMLIGLPAWHDEPVIVGGFMVGFFSFLTGAGVFRYWWGWAKGEEMTQEVAQGWRRYFSYDTNHKTIGLQYLGIAMFFLPIAGLLQMVGRLDLSQISSTPLLSAQGYESIVGDHGLMMLFIVAIPAFAGVMNYFIPLFIGARDMAFPKLNALSFWMVPPAGLLVLAGLFAGGFSTGWTLYPPLSVMPQPLGIDLVILGVIISGLSSVMSGINILTTVIRLRAPGMTPFKMPVFVWSSVATVVLSFSFTQFVAMDLTMLLLSRLMGMGFFEPTLGGNVMLYQYMFWAYSHPATYIFVLPGLGIISDIIPVFARRPLFGYKWVALSSVGIAVAGTLVFGHHMFAAAMPVFLRIPFMVTTMLVAVPTGVKVFAWVATIWGGKIRFSVPFIFVCAGIVLFLLGGLAGIVLATVPTDLYVHDTYFVVAHFHALLFGGFLFPLMAAFYYWFPKVTGKFLNEKRGRIQWWLMTSGAFTFVIPMFLLGLEGMRRRVAYYNPATISQSFQIASGIGGFLIGLGILVFFVNIYLGLRNGEKAGINPWEGRTLEWTVSSPPPENNFAQLPESIGDPYDYDPGEPAVYQAQRV